jgi:uncharacterized protein YbaR (Trm112 family)
MTKPDDNGQSGKPHLSRDLLSVLVCPACHESLDEHGEALLCRGCGRSYPIREGIPVMLIEEAGPPRKPDAD